MREKVIIDDEEPVEIINRARPSVPPEWYIPYENTPLGVPPMADFGSGYRYNITGLTHDVRGFPTARPDEIEPFNERLIRKISMNRAEISITEHFMTEDAEITIIAYGCVARSAKRAVLQAREQGIPVGLLKLTTLWPFVRGEMEKILPGTRLFIVPEMNMGQLSREVKRVNRGIARVITLNKVDGTIIMPQEILQKIMEVA
ncbi:MAG: 2-oxoacid:acceptor oxidoreductase subunit alpha, partial [Smithellaceae bacterium]|nr:2-oxoacid:acceptor oxidoreductase subunit alpha [Smithellaceae bacterium]